MITKNEIDIVSNNIILSRNVKILQKMKFDSEHRMVCEYIDVIEK